ncbi:MAG: 2-C-methyl-D-erythritol 4-phosphate cytidylyltransferase [Planctomycetaceae bacterium]
MPKFAVILPAAGNSTRFQQHQRKKVFVELKGRPVWVRSVEYFVNRDDVVQTIVTIAPDDLEWFREKFRANLAFLNVEVVAGGKERADSVQNALAKVRDDVDYVAVHDAARPLLTKDWINDVFTAAEKSGAALLATPVTSTLKRADEHQVVQQTVDRSRLWAAQTPQVFRYDLLQQAYQKRGALNATDEAQLVEQLGHPVQIVPCSPLNLKITTQDDFRMAEVLLDVLPKEKGLGALHPFADEDPRFR